MGRLKAFGGLWKDTFAEWSEDRASTFAAAMALYTVLALGPLMLLIVSVAGLIFGEQAAQAEIIRNTQGIVGAQGARAIETVLQNASRPGSGIPGAILGFAILVFGLTGLVGQMQTALNTIWEVEPKPGQGIKRLLRQRLYSLGALAGLLFVLLVALVVTTAVAALVGTFTGGASTVMARVLNIVVSIFVFTLIFGFIFKVVPEAKVRGRDVWLGAAVTAILFAIGREGIGLYLSYSSTAGYFGAAGSLVVLIIFIYYSAQIFFVGSEFTQVYANRHGGGVHPEKHARIIPQPPETRGDKGEGNSEKAASGRPSDC